MKAIILVLSFYITFPQAKAEVGCSLGATTRCGYTCRKTFCEGGLEGFIKGDTRLKAIKVRVIDTDTNAVKAEETLANPPEVLEYYGDPRKVNQDRWIFDLLNKKGIQVERADKIIIASDYGLVLGDDVMLYEDGYGMKEKGPLGKLSQKTDSNNASRKLRAKCEYTNTPIVFRSQRCPNETSCISTVDCLIDGMGKVEGIQVLCRSETKDTCPSPSKCILDDSKHIREASLPYNKDRLMEYSIDDDTEENKPVSISPAGAIQ